MVELLLGELDVVEPSPLVDELLAYPPLELAGGELVGEELKPDVSATLPLQPRSRAKTMRRTRAILSPRPSMRKIASA